MFQNSYRFNKKTLEFEKVDYRSTKKILQVLGIFTGAVSLVFIVAVGILFTVFDFKTANMMKHENQQMKSQYEKLKDKLGKVELVLSDLETRDDNLYRFLLNAKPIPKTIRQAGFGGSAKYKHLEGHQFSDLLIETSKRIDRLSKKAVIQSKSYKDVAQLAKEKAKMMQCIPALQPVSLNQARLSSHFGVRFHPILRRRKMHTGLDFSARVGTPIYAPGNGTVISTKFTSGYGREILISHGYGYVTRYAHLKAIGVKRGQKVKRGDLIGKVGSSGLSTGPHLHYEIIKDGRKINPAGFFFPDLTPEEYNRLRQPNTKLAR